MKISTIFFDLDDTLYPSDSGVWQAVRARIESYMFEKLNIQRELIPEMRDRYLQTNGTTLAGLLQDYAIDPDEYLVYVHDVPIEEMIVKNERLVTMLGGLKQSKWIFTNSSIAHTRRVLARLGIEPFFDGILDIKAMGYRSKPHADAYPLAFKQAKLAAAADALFVDDRIENLLPARELGANTVLVGSSSPDYAPRIQRVEDLVKELPELRVTEGART